MIHRLKTIQPYFNDVQCGKKTFEIRRDDRDFKIGDTIRLKEFKDGKETPRIWFDKKIKYILRDAEQFGLMKGYCILGF